MRVLCVMEGYYLSPDVLTPAEPGSLVRLDVPAENANVGAEFEIIVRVRVQSVLGA